MDNKMLCSVYHGYQVTCFHWGTRMPPSWGHTAHSSHSDTFSSTPPRSTPPGRVSGTSPLSSPVGNHTMRPLATSLRHFCMDGLSWGKYWINERYNFILRLAELKYYFYGQHNFHHLEDKQEVRGGGGVFTQCIWGICRPGAWRANGLLFPHTKKILGQWSALLWKILTTLWVRDIL